jgi:ParB-like chromosome segregation protein Spo0J
LKPAPNNARTHSKRQIKLIVRSIERFGFMNPILIDGEQGIIAGHGRWAAAKLLGLKVVPILRFEHLSDADKRAYILADNRIAEKAGWDREILAIELQAFVDMDFDIELTGFEMPEVELILDEALEISQPPLSPEDTIPEARGLENLS